MLYIFSIILGAILGFLSKNKITNYFKSFLIVKKNHYRVKFHAYFIIHRVGSKVNEIIKTESIEVLVTAKNDDEIVETLRDIIENESRLEIESIELCN